MGFIEMWEEADLADAEIGGMDSVPEDEQHDYQMGLLIALSDEFKTPTVFYAITCKE